MNDLVSVSIALAFNALDIITGIIGAVRSKNLESCKLRDGLFKKVAFIFCYFVAWLLDNYGAAVGFHFGVTLLPVIILYVVGTELVSIIENICQINPDLVPDKLMQLFNLTNLEDKDNSGH